MALVGGSLSVNAARSATLNRNTPDNADSVKIMAIKIKFEIVGWLI